MRDRQAGMTFIGFLCIAALVAFVGYGAIRLVPMYSTQMKVARVLKDLKAENDGDNPTQSHLQSELGRRLDIEMVEFPKRQDFTIAKSEEGFRVGVSYQDSVPYIANLSLMATFDNSVEIRR